MTLDKHHILTYRYLRIRSNVRLPFAYGESSPRLAACRWCALPTCRLPLAPVFSTNVRYTVRPIALARASSRLSSVVPNRDCRRNRERPDPTPSHTSSNSAGLVRPHPMRIGLDDNQTNWDERVVRPVVLTSPSLAFGILTVRTGGGK